MKIQLHIEIDRHLYDLLAETLEEAGVKLSGVEYLEQYLSFYFKASSFFYGKEGPYKEALVQFIKDVEEWKRGIVVKEVESESSSDSTL